MEHDGKQSCNSSNPLFGRVYVSWIAGTPPWVSLDHLSLANMLRLQFSTATPSGSGWKETFLTSVHRDASLVGAAFQPRIKASMIVLNVSSIQLQHIIRNTSLSIYDMLQLICVRLYILCIFKYIQNKT